MNSKFVKIALTAGVMAAVAFSGCKKKEKEETKDKVEKKVDKKDDKKVDKKDDKKVEKKVEKKKELFHKDAIDKALAMKEAKNPIAKTVADGIKKMAEDCKKSVKYVGSYWTCKEYKEFNEKTLKPIFKDLKPDNKVTIEAAVAVALGGIKHLNSKSDWERILGLYMVEQTMYNLSWNKITDYRKPLIKVAALSLKESLSNDETKMAIKIIGNDGGRAEFMGGKYEAKLLYWAAKNHKDQYVRYEAIRYLGYCTKAKKCEKIDAAKITKLYEKETYASGKDYLADAAANLGMKKEVYDWCHKLMNEGNFHWGCSAALPKVLTKDDFEKFLKDVDTYVATDKGKQGTSVSYLLEILSNGVNKLSFPKDKVWAFIVKVWEQPESISKRGYYFFNTPYYNLKRIAKTKKELQDLEKIAKKQQAKVVKEFGKDKNRKNVIEDFAKRMKELKEAIKKAK